MEMDLFGVSISTWHGLVVEMHTGIIVFIAIALSARVVVDLFSRSATPSPRVEAVRRQSDEIAFIGSIPAVFFLVLSAITGYFIQSYSNLISSPLLINKALVALSALFFWCAFLFIRLRFGSEMWKKKGLYVLGMLTAFLGFLSTVFASCMGALIGIGQSVLDPIYKALGFSWRTFQLQPLEIEATAALMAVGVFMVLFLSLRRAKPAAA